MFATERCERLIHVERVSTADGGPSSSPTVNNVSDAGLCFKLLPASPGASSTMRKQDMPGSCDLPCPDGANPNRRHASSLVWRGWLFLSVCARVALCLCPPPGMLAHTKHAPAPAPARTQTDDMAVNAAPGSLDVLVRHEMRQARKVPKRHRIAARLSRPGQQLVVCSQQHESRTAGRVTEPDSLPLGGRHASDGPNIGP